MPLTLTPLVILPSVYPGAATFPDATLFPGPTSALTLTAL